MFAWFKLKTLCHCFFRSFDHNDLKKFIWGDQTGSKQDEWQPATREKVTILRDRQRRQEKKGAKSNGKSLRIRNIHGRAVLAHQTEMKQTELTRDSSEDTGIKASHHKFCLWTTTQRKCQPYINMVCLLNCVCMSHINCTLVCLVASACVITGWMFEWEIMCQCCMLPLICGVCLQACVYVPAKNSLMTVSLWS